MGSLAVKELFIIYGANANTNQSATSLITEINPDLILFTQTSAGLALGLGGLGLFATVSIFLRVFKCKVGVGLKVIFAIVSSTRFPSSLCTVADVIILALQ